jgi:hypothetical protein
MTSFWQNWLKLWASGVILFGVVLASGAFAATDALVRPIFDMLGHPFPSEPDAHHRFSLGLMGAVSIGWGLTLLGMINAIFGLARDSAAPFWRAILVATMIWYVVDGYISYATGFALNIVSNTLLVALLLIPLIKSGALRDGNPA